MTFSAGWFEKFLQRNNLTMRKVTGNKKVNIE
jgi:hypothetical protein